MVSSTATPENTFQSSLQKAELHRVFLEALKEDVGLVALKGFKLDLSANKDFHKLFFAARCECGTSALLSVEVGKSKTLEEVKQALPGLVKHLRSKEQTFRSMSCEMHARMRTGGRT